MGTSRCVSSAVQAASKASGLAGTSLHTCWRARLRHRPAGATRQSPGMRACCNGNAVSWDCILIRCSSGFARGLERSLLKSHPPLSGARLRARPAAVRLRVDQNDQLEAIAGRLRASAVRSAACCAPRAALSMPRQGPAAEASAGSRLQPAHPMAPSSRELGEAAIVLSSRYEQRLLQPGAQGRGARGEFGGWASGPRRGGGRLGARRPYRGCLAAPPAVVLECWRLPCSCSRAWQRAGTSQLALSLHRLHVSTPLRAAAL
jgi:hypothetical protein